MARAGQLILVFALLVAGLFFSGPLSAASCSSGADQCTEGLAKSLAFAWSGAQARCVSTVGPTGTIGSNVVSQIKNSPTTGYFAVAAPCYFNGNLIAQVSPKSPDQIAWYYTQSCSSEPSYTGSGPWGTYVGSARNGSLACRNGCDGAWFSNADDTMTWKGTGGTCPTDPKAVCEAMGASSGYYWNAVLKVCEPQEAKCASGQSKDAGGNCIDSCPSGMVLQQDGTCANEKNECPAGYIKSPAGTCLPGDGQCAKGEALGKDGTCKRDSDGDGVPDEGEDDGTADPTFSGGDSCDSPPSCSGDVIMCGQARIQWRIDCNTRKNRNISGGSCNSPPICTGEKCDAMEYSSMLFQWRSACAAEKLLAKNGSDSSGDQPEWTKVAGMSQNPGAGASDGDTAVVQDHAVSTSDLDQSGFGGGSCMGFASGGGSGVSSGFTQTLASPPSWWCDYVGWIKAVIILSASVASVFILSRGGAS